MLDLTGSIVLYKNNPKILSEAIKSFLNSTLSVRLFLIDNSPSDELRYICPDGRCTYIFNGKNIGFGKAHNIALRIATNESRYHLVLNPDIYFEKGVLEDIFSFMETNPDVGQIMPKVLYPDGNIQYLCKMLPTPADLLLRRFLGGVARSRNEVYELRASGYDKIMTIPYLSGCFMFIRTSVLKKVGFFDERIFMYIEDADLTRRIHQKYRTLYYPHVKVTHHYEKGSYKNFKLMLYNIHGAVIYFTKWGWFFDKERKKINRELINNYLK